MKKLLIPVIATLFVVSCGKEQDKYKAIKAADSLNVVRKKDAVPIIQTSKQANNSIYNLKYDAELLYGTWTVDNNGPHADFKLTKESFYVVDSEDGGNQAYSINNDTLTVRYKDYNAVGVIKKAVKDTLVINWDNSSDIMYVTWKG